MKSVRIISPSKVYKVFFVLLILLLFGISLVVPFFFFISLISSITEPEIVIEKLQEHFKILRKRLLCVFRP